MSSGMIFVIIMVAIMTVVRIVRSAMDFEARKQGFSLGRRRGRGDRGADEGRIDAALAQENHMLRGKVGRLEDRMAVLERIATDVPTRLTAEIENLR